MLLYKLIHILVLLAMYIFILLTAESTFIRYRLILMALEIILAAQAVVPLEAVLQVVLLEALVQL